MAVYTSYILLAPFTITQDGPKLSAVRTRAGAPELKLDGSVRGERVWLRGGSETYLGHRQPDGRVVGNWFVGGKSGKLVLDAVGP